jgi:hypothetical protein
MLMVQLKAAKQRNKDRNIYTEYSDNFKIIALVMFGDKPL